jgi:hypothetical protein
MKPVITNAKHPGSGFSVKFPKGIDGEPDVVINGLIMDCDGESAIYGALIACGNYMLDH